VIACHEKPTTLKRKRIDPIVEELFRSSLGSNTITKGGWCLQEGITHMLETDTSGRLLSLVQENGLPRTYSVVEDAVCRHEEKEDDNKSKHKPQDCFQSLCRIIAGQQLAGAAAKSMWIRLLSVAQPLSPESITTLAKKGMEEHLRKPAGLSNAKARSIVALSDTFLSGELSETFLTNPTSTEDEIRTKLLSVKGIGPWTCDMFLMFYLEKPGVMSLGDLGVRKGIAEFFGLKGRGYKGSLCDKKDRDVMEAAVAPYAPYHSLMAYYMWAVADTKDMFRDPESNSKEQKEAAVIPKSTSPSKAENTKRARKVVTP